MEKIVEMTEFIFEDGNTYYFKIFKANIRHDLFVYRKKEVRIFSYYVRLNKNARWVGHQLNIDEIKMEIKKVILFSRSSASKIKGLDGFVGNVPESTKKALSRDSKINKLFKSKHHEEI